MALKADLVELFREKAALLKGHFLLSSGKHSPDYFQCALILQYPDTAEQLARELAKRITVAVQTVVSPAMGGIIIGQEVGRALHAKAIFTEREDGVMKLRRGFTLSQGEKVLIVEDVLTTGKSSLEVINIVKEQGAQVVALASIVNRSVKDITLDVPVFSLVKLPLEIYEPDNCPLCKKGLPLVKPGSRTKLK